MESAKGKIRHGTELIGYTKQVIVGMTQFQGMLIIATDHGVYRYINGKFHQIKLVSIDE